MRGPSAARAKMKTVSVFATLAASAGLTSTRPAIVAPLADEAVAAARADSVRRGAELPVTGKPLPSVLADSISAMVVLTCFASSEAWGLCARTRRLHGGAAS